MATNAGRAEGEEMKPCWCHGPDYPHEWGETEWCCEPSEDEGDFSIEEGDREESRYIDRENARDINRR